MQGRVENLVARVLYSFLAGMGVFVTQDPKIWTIVRVA